MNYHNSLSISTTYVPGSCHQRVPALHINTQWLPSLIFLLMLNRSLTTLTFHWSLTHFMRPAPNSAGCQGKLSFAIFRLIPGALGAWGQEGSEPKGFFLVLFTVTTDVIYKDKPLKPRHNRQRKNTEGIPFGQQRLVFKLLKICVTHFLFCHTF